MRAWSRRHLLIIALLVAITSVVYASGSLAQSNNQTPWITDGRPNVLARQAVETLQLAADQGLDPNDYLAARLWKEMQALADSPAVTEAALVTFNDTLTKAMTRYLRDLAVGRVSAEQVHHRFDGVQARSFDAKAVLQAAIDRGDIQYAVLAAEPKFPLYPSLKRALAQYRALGANRAWVTELPLPAGRKLDVGQSYRELPIVRERLVLLGDLPASALEAGDLYDEATLAAVKAFQLRHGLDADGVLGSKTLAALNVSPAQRAEQIALSMERVRWTPLHQGDRLIAVNLPGFMLYAYEVDKHGAIDIKVEMRVVVGSSLNHRTPLFDEAMRYIEFSPYWNVPPSIARGEIIPALRKNPGYLAAQQMEFVDGAGRVSTVVTEQKIQQVLAGKLRIRQRPGPHNALGAIKFIFPNNENIYMHHTPATHLFARDRRDFSHGCIRLEKPVELAKFVLEDEPQWTEQAILDAMAAGQSKTIRLREPLPVLIAYSTVLTRNGTVFFYPDIYGHDATLRKALKNYAGLQ